MKALITLTAAAVLGSALTTAAFAHSGAPGHTHMIVGPAPAVALTPMFEKRPEWSYRIDRSVLHPIPKPFPWPGPICLSCPAMDLGERVMTPILR